MVLLFRPGPVSTYLRAGGYPVIVPDGGAFPRGMKVFGDMELPNLTFNPVEGRATKAVQSPLPGNWFMLAHTNPKTRDMDFVEMVRPI